MKRVRFESPVKPLKTMHDFECHSPRPFIEKQINTVQPLCLPYNTSVPFVNDPVHRYDYGNCSPYPVANKTCITDNLKIANKFSPSNDLDLSILDSTDLRNIRRNEGHLGHDSSKPVLNTTETNTPSVDRTSVSRILSPTRKKNISCTPPNILSKNKDFFLRRDGLHGFNIHKLQHQLNDLHLDKENNPMLKKSELMQLGISNKSLKHSLKPPVSLPVQDTHCRCHSCVKTYNAPSNFGTPYGETNENQTVATKHSVCNCAKVQLIKHSHCPCNSPPIKQLMPCSCNHTPATQYPSYAVDEKSWAIEKFGQQKSVDCMEVERQSNITPEKREPTVADLFKIIKMQNEQLQLLQEKVDKFIDSNKNEEKETTQPMQNCTTEHVALETMEREEKISIGVMTSFEMVRTSTIINKEIVKQKDNQIQCNRSQISIKEVVSKSQPVNLNFLDGIPNNQAELMLHSNSDTSHNERSCIGNALEDKTFNEVSLYNVQVENAITPLMSPEQSLYLDVKDYSDSDASDDQSNVGWTYYNKVMTHVNGMLQESDMPSSASAMYRNTKQKCMQMHFDKTNVSVAKRVTFGDNPIGIQKQYNINPPSTETSLKMNQLAAKYLKNATQSQTPSPRPVDMSVATRNYMEKHKLLQGTNGTSLQPVDIPKFLDITALKQQPKFL